MAESRDKKWCLKGMTALVTGGTRGIGYAIVEELAGFGARVHTCSRNEKEIKERVEEWTRKGYKVSGSVCDVSVREQRRNLVADVSSAFDGKLNILVNNAWTIRHGKTIDHTEEDYTTIMSTNLESPYHLCQIACPLLKSSSNSSIVFVSSVAGIVSLPLLSVYAAAKGGINQLTKNLACAWAKDNIRTNCVAPSATRTTLSEKPDAVIEKAIDGIISANRGGRGCGSSGGFPLPAGCFINGQVICVDGGLTVNGL